MTLTDAQREAAVELLSIGIDGAHNWKNMSEGDRADTRRDAANALDALTDAGYTVVPPTETPKACPTCGGHGGSRSWTLQCPRCKGSGIDGGTA